MLTPENSNICVNNSVEDVKIDGDKVFDIFNLTSCCPSATSLTLCIFDTLNFNIFEQISKSMLNLKTLKIKAKFNNFDQNLKFENLEVLKITNMSSRFEETWHKIALLCPNLKKLTLFATNFEISSKNLEIILEKCQKLEIISFKAARNFLVFQSFFNAFVNFPGKINLIKFSVWTCDGYLYEGVEYLKRETN